MAKTYLAADVGGTHARIHLYKLTKDGEESLIGEQVYSSPRFPSLTAVVNNFFEDENITDTPDSACFSVCGPVKDGKVEMTNLGWTCFEHELEAELCGKKVRLLNDFEACGYGINLLQENELHELSNSRKITPGNPKIIIGAGTGLGEAFIFERGDEYMVIGGEGGHSDFAPRNRTEFDMMQFIKRKLNLSRVAVERIVSGPGLVNIYWFFANQEPKLENQELSNKIRADDNAGRIISKHAIEESDVLCEKALRLFVSCYGAETGNMALSVLPAGGIYIAGGIAPELRDYMPQTFLENCYNKGRMRSLLTEFPIYIVLNKSVGILGARYVARRMLGDARKEIDLKRRLSPSDVSREVMDCENLCLEECKDAKEKLRYEISKMSRAERLKKNFSGSDLRERQSRVVGSLEEKSNGMVKSLLVMGSGILFSAVIVTAFMIGKNSSSEE